MLHAGAEAMTREAVRGVPLPEAMGSRHVIRPFIDDIELIDVYMTNKGYTIKEEAFGVRFNKNNKLPTQFFGIMEIVDNLNRVTSNNFAITIGLRGSYDQSLPRGIAVGSRVFVCDNLAFSGEINIHTRQTTFIAERMPELLYQACSEIPDMVKHQEDTYEYYKKAFIQKNVGDAALTNMVRLGILNPSQIGRAIEEWDNSDDFSLWSLYNAITEAIKPANRAREAINATWDRTIKLKEFLSNIN